MSWAQPRKPEVGMIVLYQGDHPAPWPAIVTRVYSESDGHTISLQAFPDRHSPPRWVDRVTFSIVPTVGHWSWPGWVDLVPPAPLQGMRLG